MTIPDKPKNQPNPDNPENKPNPEAVRKLLKAIRAWREKQRQMA